MARTDNTQAESAIPAEGVIGTHSISGDTGHVQDEESPLLPRPDAEPKKALKSVGTIIAVLLLGK
jgi:hypothetical protein